MYEIISKSSFAITPIFVIEIIVEHFSLLCNVTVLALINRNVLWRMFELILEYKAINVELDKMFSALDALEQKNDNLYNQLKDVLAKSREERKSKESSDDSQNQPSKN